MMTISSEVMATARGVRSGRVPSGSVVGALMWCEMCGVAATEILRAKTMPGECGWTVAWTARAAEPWAIPRRPMIGFSLAIRPRRLTGPFMPHVSGTSIWIRFRAMTAATRAYRRATPFAGRLAARGGFILGLVSLFFGSGETRATAKTPAPGRKPKPSRAAAFGRSVTLLRPFRSGLLGSGPFIIGPCMLASQRRRHDQGGQIDTLRVSHFN